MTIGTGANWSGKAIGTKEVSWTLEFSNSPAQVGDVRFVIGTDANPKQIAQTLACCWNLKYVHGPCATATGAVVRWDVKEMCRMSFRTDGLEHVLPKDGPPEPVMDGVKVNNQSKKPFVMAAEGSGSTEDEATVQRC